MSKEAACLRTYALG